MARLVVPSIPKPPDPAKPAVGTDASEGNLTRVVLDPSATTEATEPTTAPVAPAETADSKTPADTPAPAEKPAEKPPEAKTEADAEKIVADKGFDMAALQKEYAEKGALSDETFAAFEKAGIPRSEVESYIEGQKARSTLLAQEFHKIAGGEDKLAAVMKWAGEGQNLTDAQKRAYNAALDSGDSAQATLALRGIISTYADVNGSEPTLVSGAPTRTTSESAVKPFESRVQITDAMQSRAYKTDPAFRKSVEARLAITDTGVFGR